MKRGVLANLGEIVNNPCACSANFGRCSTVRVGGVVRSPPNLVEPAPQLARTRPSFDRRKLFEPAQDLAEIFPMFVDPGRALVEPTIRPQSGRVRTKCGRNRSHPPSFGRSGPNLRWARWPRSQKPAVSEGRRTGTLPEKSAQGGSRADAGPEGHGVARKLAPPA